MSNRLPVLLDLIKSANVVFERADRIAAEAAFDMGCALCEAKDLVAHGRWLAFLDQAGLSARSAQRWMQVASSGYTRQHIAEIGIATALEEIAEAQDVVPPIGEARKIVLAAGCERSAVMLLWRQSKTHGGMIQVWPDGDRCMGLFKQDLPIPLLAWFAVLFGCDLNTRDRKWPVLRDVIVCQNEGSRLLRIFADAINHPHEAQP